MLREVLVAGATREPVPAHSQSKVEIMLADMFSSVSPFMPFRPRCTGSGPSHTRLSLPTSGKTAPDRQAHKLVNSDSPSLRLSILD